LSIVEIVNSISDVACDPGLTFGLEMFRMPTFTRVCRSFFLSSPFLLDLGVLFLIERRHVRGFG
jgi:hypothetical protein